MRCHSSSLKSALPVICRPRQFSIVTSVPIGVYGQTLAAALSGSSTQPRLCGVPNELRVKAWIASPLVEVANEPDAGIVVVTAVGIRTAHLADRDVLEDGERAELRRRGRHARVARRAEDHPAVVPEVERLRQLAMHEDVAVARRSAFARDRIADQGLPEDGARDAIDRKGVPVLEHHHGAAREQLRPARAPEPAELLGRLLEAPAELPGRRRARGDELRAERARDGRGARVPVHREIAELGQQLLQPQHRPGRHLPLQRLRELGPGAAGQVHRSGQLDAHLRAEAEAEAARLERERVLVEQVPAAGERRRDARPAGAENLA